MNTKDNFKVIKINETELTAEYLWAKAAIEKGDDQKACGLIELLEIDEINKLSKDGMSLLSTAIRYESDIAFAMLLEKGADVNLKTADGQLPLMMSLRAKREDYCLALLECGANQALREDKLSDSAVRLAARFVLKKALVTLLRSGADLEERDETGCRLIDYANKYSSKEVSEIIASFYPNSEIMNNAIERLMNAKRKVKELEITM